MCSLDSSFLVLFKCVITSVSAVFRINYKPWPFEGCTELNSPAVVTSPAGTMTVPLCTTVSYWFNDQSIVKIIFPEQAMRFTHSLGSWMWFMSAGNLFFNFGCLVWLINVACC